MNEENGSQEQFLNALKQVEKATSRQFKLEEILEKLSKEIQKLGFDFCNISLISQEQKTIESVHGTGIATQWSNLAKHYLEEDPKLRDIQADIVATLHTEIISGWDKRFDRWIYEEREHDKITRVFTPIVIVENDDGRLIKDWFEFYDWVKIVNLPQDDREGQHEIYQMRLVENLQPKGLNTEFIVIGTVEAGYCSPNRIIDYKELVQLLQCIAKRSLDIWHSQFPYVLETIAEKAKQFLNADAATFYFLYEPDKQQGRYTYQAFCGGIGKQFLKACPPRNNGLGRQAIQDKKPKMIPDPLVGHNSSSMEKLNPKAFKAGIKAMVAFPVLYDGREGVLYLLFRREHKFIKDELDKVESFVKQWVISAICYSTQIQKMRDGVRWRALHTVTQSLSRIPEVSNILRRIAWNSLNVLGADVVTIYEYVQNKKQFITPPKKAGRFIEENKMHEKISAENLPFVLIKRGQNVYASQIVKEKIFQNAPFTSREKIKSAGGILLKVDENIVGVMFVNYRRPHNFSEEEIKIIENLASIAAIAIQNHRWLTARDEINHLIITTIDQNELLRLVVRKALEISDADIGGIYLFDSSNQQLVTQFEETASGKTIDSCETISINQGISGWVAKHGQSLLVNNTQSDTRYHRYFKNTNSELCVPLLDKENHVFGVINLESQRIKAFNQRQQKMLEALANQAVIGIQSLEIKKQFVQMETLSNFSTLIGQFQLAHRTNNDFGAIRVLAQDITNNEDKGQEYNKKQATRIELIANKFLQYATYMTDLTKEGLKYVNVHQTVINALYEISIPPEITKYIDIPTDLPGVFAGEKLLMGVFENIIQNAVDAMPLPQGGSLSIIGRSINGINPQKEVGSWVEVEICDTGVGIAVENRNNIFEYGYTTKNNKRGMGFGLWSAKIYLQQFIQGSLDVDSVLGQGSRFTVRLPVYKKPEAEL
jgi:GAF domain-containing protein